MAKTKTLIYKQTIQASLSDVYAYFTNPTFLREWFCDVAHAEVRKGGRLYFAWNDGYVMNSQFDTLTSPRTIAYAWNGKNETPSKVKIALTAKGGGTAVTVSHSGLAANKKILKGFEDAWQSSLTNLKSVMETGEDRRLTMRPMMGITGFEVVTSEVSAQHNLPVQGGIRIGGTVAGMGAERSGIKGGDVLMSLGGKKLTTFPSIANALQGRQAGEVVKVVLYRGQEKLTIPMELSKRPIPPLPATAKELALAVQNIYDAANAELEKILANATEAQVSHRATPDAWNVKDVLAHLIIGERDTQSFLVEVIEGAQRSYDAFPSNSAIRHQAIFATHPTLKDLLAEWRKGQRELFAMHELLPASFIARKGSYWQYAYGALQGHIHLNDHLKQIKELLEPRPA